MKDHELVPVQSPFCQGPNQRFTGGVNFAKYNRQTMAAKPKEGFWPLVIHTNSWFNADPMTRYSQILYCDMDTGPGTIRLLRRKFLTP